MKHIFLKFLILANTLYFGFTVYVAYAWDKFQNTKGSNGDRWYKLQNSALIEEFGYVSYLVSAVLVMVCVFVKKRPLQWLWFDLALLPIFGIVLIFMAGTF